jgi:hypothetical protein
MSPIIEYNTLRFRLVLSDTTCDVISGELKLLTARMGTASVGSTDE